MEILVCHEFGNYFIQELFGLLPYHELQDHYKLIGTIFGKIACNKFASIVLAKCISKYWKGVEEIYTFTASTMSTKKALLMQKDR